MVFPRNKNCFVAMKCVSSRLLTHVNNYHLLLLLSSALFFSFHIFNVVVYECNQRYQDNVYRTNKISDTCSVFDTRITPKILNYCNCSWRWYQMQAFFWVITVRKFQSNTFHYCVDNTENCDIPCSNFSTPHMELVF